MARDQLLSSLHTYFDAVCVYVECSLKCVISRQLLNATVNGSLQYKQMHGHKDTVL